MLAELVSIIVLFSFGTALATTANVYLRSVVLQKEIATRRVLGATRSQIVSQLVLESMFGVAVGILVGAAAITLAALLLGSPVSVTAVLIGAALLACSGIAGSWLAARHAANTPFCRSGLFASASDRRGEPS